MLNRADASTFCDVAGKKVDDKQRGNDSKQTFHIQKQSFDIYDSLKGTLHL